MFRIMLFLATNLAIVVVLGIVMEIFGLRGVLDEQGVGLDLNALLIISAVVGMTGSFISLAISSPRSSSASWPVPLSCGSAATANSAPMRAGRNWPAATR